METTNVPYTKTNMEYDYSILIDHFPESVIEEFKASAIKPELCLLNAEFLNGDKSIAELLPHAKDTHDNKGSLRKKYRDRYASIIDHGGTAYTGIDIERGCIADSCQSFKPLQPRLDNEGKPIKYENPPNKPSKAFLPIIDGETWLEISKRVGVDLPPDVEADRQWQRKQIGSAEWRQWCEDLSLKFLEWIQGNSSIPSAKTEGCKKALAGTSTGVICISLTGIWNGCPEKNKGEKDYTLIDDLKIIAIPGRKIIIAFDKDSKSKTVSMVRTATTRLAGLLNEAGCDVYEAEWKSEEGKGIDDLIANCGADFFHWVIDNAKPIKHSDVTSQSKEDKVKVKSAADRLLEIGETATYFHTPDKVAYADVSIDGNRHTYAVRSKAFRMWLSGEYYNTEGKGIGSQTMQDTLSTLEAIALFGNGTETRDVHLRTAEYQGKIYLDLGTPDWKAVEIDSIGWRIVLEPPIRFWRPDSLDLLRKYQAIAVADGKPFACCDDKYSS
jgi:hypothetical protein